MKTAYLTFAEAENQIKQAAASRGLDLFKIHGCMFTLNDRCRDYISFSGTKYYVRSWGRIQGRYVSVERALDCLIHGKKRNKVAARFYAAHVHADGSDYAYFHFASARARNRWVQQGDPNGGSRRACKASEVPAGQAERYPDNHFAAGNS